MSPGSKSIKPIIYRPAALSHVPSNIGNTDCLHFIKFNRYWVFGLSILYLIIRTVTYLICPYNFTYLPLMICRFYWLGRISRHSELHNLAWHLWRISLPIRPFLTEYLWDRGRTRQLSWHQRAFDSIRTFLATWFTNQSTSSICWTPCRSLSPWLSWFFFRRLFSYPHGQKRKWDYCIPRWANLLCNGG